MLVTQFAQVLSVLVVKDFNVISDTDLSSQGQVDDMLFAGDKMYPIVSVFYFIR